MFLFICIVPFPAVYVLTIVLLLPCRASNAGYWILDECLGKQDYQVSLSWSLIALLKIIGYLFTNYLMWSFSVYSILFILCVLMISVTCFRSFLKCYRDKFALESLWGSDWSRFRTAIMYREIQILVTMFNDIHESFTISSTMVVTIILQLVSMYTIVKTEFTISNIPIIVVFLLLIINIFMFMFCSLDIMGDVLEVSKGIVGELKLKERTHWLKRFHKSCFPLKIKFGASNFVEKITPLNCENFVIVQTSNALLMK